MGLDMKDFVKYAEQFKDLEKDFDKFLKNWTIKQGAEVVSDAKKNTPPRFTVKPNAVSQSTGRFKNSFYWKDYRKSGNNAQITVGNSVEYASHLEYGFHIKGGPGRSQVVGFKDGYFIFTKALNKVENQMPDSFDKEFTAFLKQKGII